MPLHAKRPSQNSANNEYRQHESVVLSIANVARMFGVSILTLWIYELRGLIRRERDGRQRVYSWRDCERIALILKARKAGIGVAKFGAVIKATDEHAADTVAQHGRLQCQALIHALEAQQRTAANALAELNRIDLELSARLVRHAAEHPGQTAI